MADEPRVRWVEEQLKGMSLGDSAPAAVSAGGLALAQFTLDNNWYRAYVEKVGAGKNDGCVEGVAWWGMRD